jgi:hypothetical protein
MGVIFIVYETSLPVVHLHSSKLVFYMDVLVEGAVILGELYRNLIYFIEI